MGDEYLFEFIGISFRSYSHFYWFLGSMAMFAVSGATFLLGMTRMLKSENAVMAQACWGLALFFHVFACVGATHHAYEQVYVRSESPNGPLFSVDCIWFNALIASLYVAMFIIFRRSRRQLRKTAEPNPFR